MKNKKEKYYVCECFEEALQLYYDKKIKELYIRMRAQTLMFDAEDATHKYNYFYNNYRELQKLILRKEKM